MGTIDWSLQQGEADATAGGHDDDVPFFGGDGAPLKAAQEEDEEEAGSMADVDLQYLNDLSWRTWNEMSCPYPALTRATQPEAHQGPPGLRAMEEWLRQSATTTVPEASLSKEPEVPAAEPPHHLDNASRVSAAPGAEACGLAVAEELPAATQGEQLPEVRRSGDDRPAQAAIAVPPVAPPPVAPPPVAPPVALPRNRGSRGHPELCARICLYYASGGCANKDDCDFCHLEHLRRPVRLDKRHRERFERLSTQERIFVVLPVIRQRAAVAKLPAEEVEGLLRKLEAQCTADPKVLAERTRVSRSLIRALEAMSVRSLLSMVECEPEVPTIQE